LYISAEIFTQQYIDSVKKNNRNDFIHFYQLIDVLIIDDVHLSGKSGTQDVFFHIFNYLHQNGKQVILTSDKVPLTCKISSNDYYLVSNGTVSRIAPTWLRNKNFYLKNILYRDGVEIPEEIIEYVARNIKSNVRELEEQ
jgi:chromosomal replication initiator protein